MSSNPIISAARSINTKFESFNKRSGEITNGLRKLPGGSGLYEQAQAAERTLRLAKQAWDAQDLALESSSIKQDAARKQLIAVFKAIVLLTEAAGISGASAVMQANDMDESAMASNLLDFARQIPQAGQGMVGALKVRRAEWLKAESNVTSVMNAYEAATRSYGEAYYSATAVVAQGKALLMASGVPVLDRKPTRKKATVTRAAPSTPATITSIAPAPSAPSVPLANVA